MPARSSRARRRRQLPRPQRHQEQRPHAPPQLVEMMVKQALRGACLLARRPAHRRRRPAGLPLARIEGDL